MDLRIAGAAYALPPDAEAVADVLLREQERVSGVLAPLPPRVRNRALEGLGLQRVRVCSSRRPYDLVREATAAALAEAGLCGSDLHLIIDYSTLPGEECQCTSLAHRLAADLNAENSVNISFKAGGCAGLHIALKTAMGWMAADSAIQNALLITGDTPPPGNRTLLPITVQGDAGSAVVVRRGEGVGPEVLVVEARTLGHLHDVIALDLRNGHAAIEVDAARVESEVMPVYYLNLIRLIDKALAAASLKLGDVDHFVYSNISQRDRDGFRRMLRLPASALPETAMAELGHTFASDLVVNYADLRAAGRIRRGDVLLFASAGIGFAWGVTLARA